MFESDEWLLTNSISATVEVDSSASLEIVGEGISESVNFTLNDTITSEFDHTESVERTFNWGVQVEATCFTSSEMLSITGTGKLLWILINSQSSNTAFNSSRQSSRFPAEVYTPSKPGISP